MHTMLNIQGMTWHMASNRNTKRYYLLYICLIPSWALAAVPCAGREEQGHGENGHTLGSHTGGHTGGPTTCSAQEGAIASAI